MGPDLHPHVLRCQRPHAEDVVLHGNHTAIGADRVRLANRALPDLRNERLAPFRLRSDGAIIR